MCNVSSSIYLSSVKVIMLVAKTCSTTCSNSYGLVLLGPCDSFRTLSKAFLSESKVINNDKIDMWAGAFFNCSATENIHFTLPSLQTPLPQN